MTDTAYDYFQLEDIRATRRYFGKLRKTVGHLTRGEVAHDIKKGHFE
ncbi:hypothetical protein L0666_07920 [Octadecabacter sp. CECT 8868]|nr:hypothetical protein [Octadecabacter algicola]MCF2904911.1 hypothetical protein [Octadecabacter algicola]